ncbi:hypothetical protein [Bacillus sp. AK128]
MNANKSKKVVHFSENVNDQLWGIIEDLTYFSFEKFEKTISSKLDHFFNQFPISEEEREYLYPYYFWWMVFCSSGTISNNKTIYQLFLQQNQWKFKKKPHLKSTLLKWQDAIPSFFVIEEIASKRFFCLVDICDHREYKIVYVPQDTFNQPTSCDMLAGIILPLADGGYFSVIDPLIIPDKVKTPFISKLKSSYQSDSTMPPREFFSKNYPQILKMTIEYLIENKIKIQ